MKGKGKNQLVSSSRASWYPIRGLILPVLKTPKQEHKSLTMAYCDSCTANAIKWYQ